MRSRELDEREALEVGPTLADLERLVRVPLDALEVALPPADAREEGQHLGAGVAGRVGEQLVRLLAELPGLRDVGVPVERDLGKRGERETLDRPLARLVGEHTYLLHLVRGCGELPQPPGGAGSFEPARERRLELERPQQQAPCRAVGLPGKRTPACLFERSARLRAQVVRNPAVELGEEGCSTV